MKEVISYELSNGQIVHEKISAMKKQKILDLEKFISDAPFLDILSNEEELTEWLLSIKKFDEFLKLLTEARHGKNITIDDYVGQACFFKSMDSNDWSTGILGSVLRGTEGSKTDPYFTKEGEETIYRKCRPMSRLTGL